MSKSRRPTRAVIDLDNLEYNFRSVKRFAGSDLKYMAVVKADAYGHGSVECAKRLESAGIDWFGVAIPDEGVELRKAGIRKRILCLGGFWRGQEKLLLNQQITPVIYRADQAESFDNEARKRGSVAEIHVKIDTGMGRIGVRYDGAAEFVKRLGDFHNLHLEGLMTHFASADDPEQDGFTALQIERFREVKELFESAGFKPVYTDLANSAGTVAHGESRKNMVRLGGILYGLGDDVLPPDIDLPEIKPVLSLYSAVAQVKSVPAGETLGYGRTFTTGRESRIATIPIGYQDGYPRQLSNRARVLIKGRSAPVVGRVSMDWTLVDVTDVPGVSEGDPVVLIGEQAGESIKAEELAGICGTISYEITCGINRRVPRSYAGSGEK